MTRKDLCSEQEKKAVGVKDHGSQEAQNGNGSHIQQRAEKPSSLFVVLATRDIATRSWYENAVSELAADHPHLHSSPDFKVEIHLTGDAKDHLESIPAATDSDLEGQIALAASPTEKGEVFRESITKAEFLGRPDLPNIIQKETAKVAADGQSLGMFVYGPATMADDVRNAVAKENLRMIGKPCGGGVYLHQENLSWA
jgi:Ferric reductase NAD binding domain